MAHTAGQHGNPSLDRRAIAAASIGLGLLSREVVRRRRTIDLQDKVVLITGSSRGLGLAMAEEFAERGAKLVLCARNEQQLAWAEETVAGHGAEVLAVPCDVADRDQVQQLVDRATNHFGQIDILVNNAGIISVGPVETQTIADFEDMMGVMFWGTVYPTLAVLPQMLERKSGRIVNITSIGGKVSFPHLLSYCASKFAAVGFSEGLAAALARNQIRVTTVVPGLMRTGSFVNAIFKGKHRAEYAWFSLGAGTPLITIDGRKAARQIVEATRRGDAEIIITPPAHLAARFYAFFPGFTTDVLGLVDRLLPGPDGASPDRRLGRDSESFISRSFLTILARRSAHTYHQYPEHADTPRPSRAGTSESMPSVD